MRRLTFEAEHETFRDSVRRFFQNEIGPHAARWRDQGYVDRWAYTKAGAQGYLLLWAEECYGGAHIDDFRYDQIVMEENMRHGDTGFYVQLHSNLVGPYLATLGNEEQKARWLPGAVRGETILAVAMTEPVLPALATRIGAGRHRGAALGTRYSFPLWEQMMIYTLFIFLIWFSLALPSETAREVGTKQLKRAPVTDLRP